MREILGTSLQRTLLLVPFICLFASSLFAADPLTGTWRLVPSNTQVTNPAQTTITSLVNGIRIQTNVGKPVDANYDDKDYPTGNGNNMINVLRINDHTLVVINERDGKLISKSTRTVSTDGKYLTNVDPPAHDHKSDAAWLKMISQGRISNILLSYFHAVLG